ncbi:hypothetical protein BAAM0499_07605 [Bifidobacterium animalis subsp. animalis MCC 0499]|nr:hypothetical protein BAAM0499_07605 [Bifidobacterium animalis subsp. animalis MCC 0499]
MTISIKWALMYNELLPCLLDSGSENHIIHRLIAQVAQHDFVHRTAPIIFHLGIGTAADPCRNRVCLIADIMKMVFPCIADECGN